MFSHTSSTFKTRIALTAGLLFIGANAMSTEQPKYSVVYQDGDVEYRQYEPYLVAETAVEQAGNYKSAGNEGFRRLFGYITGSNKVGAEVAMTAPVAQTSAGQKIAMTAPVQRDGTDAGSRVAFMLPSQYTMETAPVPTDPRVRIRQVPGRLMAVVRYSGRWTAKNFEAKKQLLRSELAGQEVVPVSAIQSALYDPPYTPPFMRRNEVMVEVNRLPDAAQEPSSQQIAAYQ